MRDRVQVDDQHGAPVGLDAAGGLCDQGGDAAAGGSGEGDDAPRVGPLGQVVQSGRTRVPHHCRRQGLDQVVGDSMPQQRTGEVRSVRGSDRDQRRPDRAHRGKLPGGGLGVRDAVDVDENEARGRFCRQNPQGYRQASALYLDLSTREAGP